MKRRCACRYYGDLALYNPAYMLDDGILVLTAVVTLNRFKLQQRGGRWLKLVSGTGHPQHGRRVTGSRAYYALRSGSAGHCAHGDPRGYVAALQKVAGDWPKFGDRSTGVTVGDGSAAAAMMRFQRPVITLQLSDLLITIGNSPFAATAIVVQDDRSPDGSRLGGFELWIRGADDIEAVSP